MAKANDSTVPVKACKKCGETKSVTKFPKCSKARDGRGGRCYSCGRAARSSASKASAAERVKRWKRANADRWRTVKRHQSERARRLSGALPASERVALVKAEAESRQRARLDACEARQAERRSKPWGSPLLTKAEKFAVRYRADPEFNIRVRVRAALKRKRQGIKLGDLIRGALARQGRSPRAEAFLGYTVADLRAHLERQFTAGMDWSAFVAGRIHIDHIVPLAAFNISVDGELAAAWALTNLRPLWAADNLAKASRRDFLL